MTLEVYTLCLAELLAEGMVFDICVFLGRFRNMLTM
jgi:hypothetical protein